MSGSVQVPTDWFERDDVEEVGAEAAMFYLSALALSARQLKDGHIARRQLRRLYPVTDVNQTVAVLLDAGWLDEEDGSYFLPEWRTFILSATEVEHLREMNRTRVERHRRHKAGDHSLCDRCEFVRGPRNGVTHGVSKGVINAAPTRPDPTRPDPLGEGRGRGRTGSAEASPARPEDGAETPRPLPAPRHRFEPDGHGGDCTRCPLPRTHVVHTVEAVA